MIYVVIGVLFGLCVLSGILSSLYDHQWGEFKDLLIGSLFFPCVLFVFVFITYLLGFFNPDYKLDNFHLSLFFDESHILILLPSIVIAAVLLIPVYRITERIFPDQKRRFHRH
ncbi:hypothetical protein [Vibrio salinus]|uniref:hypothetical protein n=1 Tax=Vibrio salinus TaxID=2899784 RepID=UPI001E485CBB|nr:hypothetical protein [Vibrio salinus]MCE0495070.1 hypothetical protein [Vibrio salinus]